jgi:ribosomal protection tetracycline resistance protein
MFAGTLRTRDRVPLGRAVEGKVTAIGVCDRGSAAARGSVSAGEIGKLWGLAEVQVGDPIGAPRTAATEHHFAPPTLETVVVPLDPADKAALRVALAQLAEQDPLIDVRQDDVRQELSVSLYGEVQKEVVQATLANDFGLDVGFSETTTICIERPIGTGEAVEVLRAETKSNVTGKSSPTSSNPFLATAGLRVEPAASGSGIEFRLDVDVRLLPFYIYKTTAVFSDLMAQYVRRALQEGLCGWQVTDCVVTMTDCGYLAGGTTAADFRKLTPIVVMRALREAGTVVCEPILRGCLEIPTDTIGAVLTALARLGAAVEAPAPQGKRSVIETVVPVARAHELQRRLPGLTNGEGVLDSSFAGYRPVSTHPPTRARTTANPLNLGEYIAKPSS